MALAALENAVNRRRFDRLRVDLPGDLAFGPRSTPVVVLDLSLGGARVELPLPALAYDMPALSVLRIEDVLDQRVIFRWSRDRQLGVEFRSPDLSRTGITRVLDQIRSGGLRPP